MTKMQLWSPLGDLWDLQDEINRVFRGFGPRGSREKGEISAWAPAVDICEDKEAVRLTAELPGMRKEDVKINVEDGVLTIKGERRFSEETKKENYYRIERSYGAFSRSFTLPPTVESDRIKASMRDGVLEMQIPKKEEAKPKEVKIDIA
ncbi:MAG: Hsp20/alpha crystallin family protein [Proteobacteria bacterium]|nr:Hsp20/alpha crystallin family protein [Pseudomonadota bacterium]